MKILKANIESFGCFEDRSFDLSEGFNLIVGDNESGKSTLQAFIKFILYGMPRKTQETAAERERCISFRTGRASGSILLSLENGQRYTVERRGILRVGEKRESYSEECRIIDERSGTQVHKGAVPGEMFLGVPVGVFESTALVRQMKTAEIDSDTVSDSLSNMLLSADETIDLQKALDRLDAMRKTLLHKNGKGGSLAALSEEMNELSNRLERAKADSAEILSYTESVGELKRSALARRRELDRLEDSVAAFNSISILKRFEILHGHEEKLTQLESELEKYKEENNIGGVLPNRDLSSAAEENIRSYRAAVEASRLADSRLEIAERAKKSHRRRCPEFTADEIRQKGGIDGICGTLDGLFDRSKKKKKAAVILTVLALATILSGGAVAALLPGALAAGILLCALSAVLLTFGLVTFSASKKLAVKAANELEALGGDVEGGTAALRAYLSGAFDDELAEGELEKEYSLALSASELRGADLELAKAEADRIISVWPVSKSGDRAAALEETAIRVRDYYSRSDALDSEIKLEKRTVASLTAELSPYSEADLRARVPKELAENYSESAMDELERRRRFCSTSLRSITDKQIEAERELIRLESESDDPARISAMLDETKHRYEEEKLRYDSCVAAADALTAASANIRDSVTPVIRKISGGYLSEFTSGRYTSLGIENGCVAVSAEREGGRSSLESLSAGTRDAAYFALRLSLLELLFKKELPPLILDEALTQLDDKRAARALSIISEFCRKGGQCLLFTCHGREGELTREDRTVNTVEL